MMRMVIGTDEAGYGPNLGPLVVTATAWLIAENDCHWESRNPVPNLFRVFEGVFANSSEDPKGRIRIGDSKKIFQSGSGLIELEKLVMPLSGWPKAWFQLLEKLNALPSESKLSSRNSVDKSLEAAGTALPWYDGFNPELPLELELPQNDTEEIKTSNGSCSMSQRSSVIEPREFNQGCEQLGNKATLLSHTTLSLVANLMKAHLSGKGGQQIDRIDIVCDKHGGRSRYAAILQEIFSDSWIRVISEQPAESNYEFDWGNIPVSIKFLAKGESELPIAVASMVSKYLREISMLAFNSYWQEKIPGIKPSAGYPVDARRFRKEIESSMEELELDESDWWRLR